ncbi:hypothetical protein V5735_19630 [Haladaptatus sp. SPP-AMP-3]|uniref:hypothetical protein n=1 Tax=Haladaptatus sp. SPP-AMP-3 TaxID=3121295 RepID=UPI003C2BB346
MLRRVEKRINMAQRHLEVFQTILEKEPIGIMKISKLIDYLSHKVHYSLQKLEEENWVIPTTQGVTTDQIEPFIADFDERVDGVQKKLTKIEFS